MSVKAWAFLILTFMRGLTHGEQISKAFRRHSYRFRINLSVTCLFSVLPLHIY